MMTAEGYEHRSEIISNNAKYYVQSTLVPAQEIVVTTLFHEGNMLSRHAVTYDTSLSQNELRVLVRQVHDDSKARITSLLAIRDRIKKDPSGRAHMKLGEALFRQRMYREAMAEVIRAIKLGLEAPEAYSILGNCLIALGDFEKAIKSFSKGIEIAPSYPDLHNDLGQAYLKLERCGEAVTEFEKAIELNKYYQAAFLNLAIALSQNVVLKQDYELSRELRARMPRLLDMNVQLRPSLDTETFREASSAAKTEQYEIVYQKLTEIKEELDRFSQVDLSLEIYLILKFGGDDLTIEDVDLLIKRIELALEANPGYADLQNDLGILYAAKCKLLIDEAHEAFRAALVINPGFKKAEKNLKLAANDRQGIHFLLKALLD